MDKWLQVLNTAGLVAVAYLSYLNRQATQDIHVLVNSRMDALLAAKEETTAAKVEAAHAEGAEAGRKAEVKRTEEK